jgi:DNA-directed RNA polymerase subunit RPC12/RpoP
MGLGELLSGIAKGAIGGKPHAERQAKCPKCSEHVLLGMERCPKCGTHIESMFRIECPKCKTHNELKAQKCVKCGYDFVAPATPSGQPQYRCPICGYVADYYMLSCPSCGVKFIS